MEADDDAEEQQWDELEMALVSIDAQVGNLRAMLAQLRARTGHGRHMRMHANSPFCPCHGDETWISVLYQDKRGQISPIRHKMG